MEVGKTTRPFRYDLNKIPMIYYAVEMTNGFKGLDLVDRMPELYRGLQHFTGSNNQNHPKRKQMQEGKVVV